MKKKFYPYEGRVRNVFKNFLFMYLTLFLVLLNIFGVYAKDSYSQNLNLDYKNTAVKQVLEDIKEQSDVEFFYSNDDFDINVKIDISIQNGTLEEVLQEILPANLQYKVVDRTVIISKAKMQEATSQAQQQNIIKGKVTDTDGLPLPGVSVVVKGTTIGTVTNNDGEFSLSIPDDAEVLKFSFVGMRAQEIAVDEKTTFNLVMEEDVTVLKEVVAVGYGVQKKESVVGSISQTQGESLRKNIQGADLTNSLRGQIPGLVTMQNIGVPGGYDDTFGSTGHTKMIIRGMSTWNAAEPLVLVDGVERDMYDINPYEIEKISVLKDASATAVFGVKGANGVILITTLRGQEGKPRLTFDGSVTAKTVSKIDQARTLGSYENNVMRNHALINELPTSPTAWGSMRPQEWLLYWRDQTYPEYLPDVDYIDEMVKDWGFDKNINMTASGGTPFVKYFTSISYLKEGDIMKSGEDFGVENSPQYGYDRFNFRSNFDFDFTSSTRFTVNLSGYHAVKQTMGGNQDIFFGLRGRAPDLYPVRYSDGTWANYSGYCAVQVHKVGIQ